MTSAGPKYSIIPSRALLLPKVKLPLNTIRVLMALGMHSNKYGVCWPTLRRMSDVALISEQECSKALTKLVRLKLVRRLKTKHRHGMKAVGRLQILYDAEDQPLPTDEEYWTPLGYQRQPDEQEALNDGESEGICARTREHICRKWSRLVEESTGYGVVWQDQLEHAERAMRNDISMEVIEADTKAYIARKKSVPPSLIACISHRVAA